MTRLRRLVSWRNSARQYQWFSWSNCYVILRFYFRKQTGTTLTDILRALEERDASAEGILTSCPVFVHYLLKTYSSNGIVAEYKAALRIFSHLLHQAASILHDTLWTIGIFMGLIYDEWHINSLSIEGVLPNLRQSVCSYWGNHRRAQLNTLTKYTDSLAALRGPTAGHTQPSKRNFHRGASKAMKFGQ